MWKKAVLTAQFRKYSFMSSVFLPGAFKTLDKDNDGTIKVNIQEVRKL